MCGSHEDKIPEGFRNIGPFGFPQQHEEDHPPSIDDFKPAYLASEGYQKNGYHCEELRDGVYWVTDGGYDTSFIVTDTCVIAIDAPPTLGENILAAIEAVTDKPITHVIYSHWHSDHIGAASMYGPDVTIISHDITKELLERFPDPQRPIPHQTFSKDLTLEIGGKRLELSYKGANHCPGNIFIYAPVQKVLTKIDIVSPGTTPFLHCDASENITGYIDAHRQILEYDFDFLVGGHVRRWGTREDVVTAQEYFHDMLDFAHTTLKTMSNFDTASKFLSDPDQYWVGVENWLNTMTNHVTKLMLEKVTSTGQLWQERLAGVTTMTKYHAYTVLESSRLERTHEGYQMRDGKSPAYIW